MDALHGFDDAASSQWIFEAYLVYDGGNQLVAQHVRRISQHLNDCGVRTLLDMNEAGSLRHKGALAKSTTAAAMVSAGVAVVFATHDFLVKAAGQGMAGQHDCCAIELELAFAHARNVIPAILEPALRERQEWPGELGARLADTVHTGGRTPVDLSSASCASDREGGALKAARRVFREISVRVGGVPCPGTARLDEAAGTPRALTGTEWGTPLATDELRLGSLAGAEEPAQGFPVRADDGEEGGAEEGEGRGARSERWEGRVPSLVEYQRLAKAGKPRLFQEVVEDDEHGGHAAGDAATEPEGRRSPSSGGRGVRSSLREKGRVARGHPVRDANAGSSGDDFRSNRRLSELSAEQVIRLIEKLGYGRYAVAFRLWGVDGSTLSAMGSATELARYGLKDPTMQQKLYRHLARMAVRGVHPSMLAGSSLGTTISTMWHALTGKYADPYTDEELYSRVVSARQAEESSFLASPRALTPRQQKKKQVEEVLEEELEVANNRRPSAIALATLTTFGGGMHAHMQNGGSIGLNPSHHKMFEGIREAERERALKRLQEEDDPEVALARRRAQVAAQLHSLH
jgi:hypothetical protein